MANPGSCCVPFEMAIAPAAPGPFIVAHGLGKVPALVLIQMTSDGEVWFQIPTRYDDTNIYLVASAGGITGKAEIWENA